MAIQTSGRLARRVLFPWAALLLAWGPCAAVLSGDDAGGAGEGAFRWFSVAIEVRGLPPGSQGVPVHCKIDFRKLLAARKVAGAVDERTLRLDRTEAAGKTVAQPVQFTPAARPRPKQRRLLPATTQKVSYLAEYRPGETPPGATAGVLTWIVGRAPKGTAGYRLRFGVPRGPRPSII